MKKYTSFHGKALFFILFFALLWFLNFAGRSIFSPLLPLIEDEFSINHATVTSILLLQSVGYGLSVFFSGFLSGVFGYKRSILLSLIVTAIIFFCIYFFRIFSILYAFSFIIGAATGIYLPSVIPLITTYYEQKNWSKAISIHDSAASVGVFAVPIIAVFLLDFFEWRGIFIIFGFIYVIAFLLFYFLVDELKVKKINWEAFYLFIRNRTLWVLSILWVFAASSSIGVFFIIPLYLTKELKMDIDYANTIFGISRAGGFFVSLSSGFLANRIGLPKLMAGILIISGASTVFVALAGVKIIGLALFFQASIIYGFFPLGLIAVSRLFSIEIRSVATGFVIGFGIIMGWGATPYLLGLCGDHFSFSFGILILGIAVILSSGLVYLLKDIEKQKTI
jgi:MFS family permease